MKTIWMTCAPVQGATAQRELDAGVTLDEIAIVDLCSQHLLSREPRMASTASSSWKPGVDLG